MILNCSRGCVPWQCNTLRMMQESSRLNIDTAADTRRLQRYRPATRPLLFAARGLCSLPFSVSAHCMLALDCSIDITLVRKRWFVSKASSSDSSSFNQNLTSLSHSSLKSRSGTKQTAEILLTRHFCASSAARLQHPLRGL